MQEDKKTPCDENKTVLPKKEEKTSKEKAKNDEFKRKYFEFYDDIKISDRQDW